MAHRSICFLLHSLAAGEAAERTFSCQKHFDKPLRCRMSHASIRPLFLLKLITRLVQFGDVGDILPTEREPQRLPYANKPNIQPPSKRKKPLSLPEIAFCRFQCISDALITVPSTHLHVFSAKMEVGISRKTPSNSI